MGRNEHVETTGVRRAPAYFDVSGHKVCPRYACHAGASGNQRQHKQSVRDFSPQTQTQTQARDFCQPTGTRRDRHNVRYTGGRKSQDFKRHGSISGRTNLAFSFFLSQNVRCFVRIWSIRCHRCAIPMRTDGHLGSKENFTHQLSVNLAMYNGSEMLVKIELNPWVFCEQVLLNQWLSSMLARGQYSSVSRFDTLC